MRVTVVLPVLGDLSFATRQELLALGLYLRETNPNVTNPMARAA